MKKYSKVALEKLASDILCGGGFDRKEADITAKSLVLSNLVGHDSHGIIRVVEYIAALENEEVFSKVDLEITKETDTSCLVDANGGLGQVQMNKLIDMLLLKAENNSVVSGAMKNSGHIARLGEWVEIIANKGYVGFVAVNDNGAFLCTAPPGSKQVTTSTNPIAFSIPLSENNFIIDMSTSSVALGKVRLSHISGEECAEGWVQDADGTATRDPSVLFKEPKGALIPMGGAQAYKGFALSMFVDCMVAGLSGGFTPPTADGTPLVNNVSVTIWNPEHFAGISHMQHQAEKYIDFVRNAETSKPNTPIRISGDRAESVKHERENEGIPVNNSVMKKLFKCADLYGVKFNILELS